MYVALDMSNFGLKFRAIQAQMKLDNEAMGDALNVSVQSVSSYRRLDNPVIPKREVLQKLAKMGNVTIDYLLDDSEDPLNGGEITIPSVLKAIDKLADEEQKKILRYLVDKYM